MGVHLYLLQDDEPVQVEAFEYGSVYPVGGTSSAEIAITYNYSHVYRLVVPEWPGLVEFFHGRRAGDLIPTMRMMVERLGTRQYTDYWAPTPGNAGYAMHLLLGWSEQYPDAVWHASG